MIVKLLRPGADAQMLINKLATQVPELTYLKLAEIPLHGLTSGVLNPHSPQMTKLVLLLMHKRVDVFKRFHGVARGDIVLMKFAVGAITRSPHTRI